MNGDVSSRGISNSVFKGSQRIKDSGQLVVVQSIVESNYLSSIVQEGVLPEPSPGVLLRKVVMACCTMLDLEVRHKLALVQP